MRINESYDAFYDTLLRFCSEWEYQNEEESLAESYVEDMLKIMRSSVNTFVGERRKYISHMIIKIMICQKKPFEHLKNKIQFQCQD